MQSELSKLAAAVQLDRYHISTFTGKVVSESTISKTDLSVKGGGGDISMVDGYGGGTIDPIDVKASTVHTQRLFVKNEGGQEKVFLNDPEAFVVRKGHTITFVEAHPKIRNPKVFCTHLVNHDTGQSETYTDAISEIMDGVTAGFLFILGFLALLIFAFLNPLNFSFFLIVIILLIVAGAMIWKYSEQRQALDAAFYENSDWQKFEKALLKYTSKEPV